MSYSVLGAVSFVSGLNNIVLSVKSSVKTIGLVKDVGSKCCSALFYRSVAIAYSYGSTERSKNLYKDYYIRSVSEITKTGYAFIHLLAHYTYGNEIVGFSSNPGERFCDGDTSMKIQKKSLISPDCAPLSKEVLDEVYGVDVMNRWYAWYDSLDLTAQAPPRHPSEEGCCLGMVCDFIAAYSQNRASGKSAKDSVVPIAHHFTLGASDKAQIAQIFYLSVVYAIKKSPLGLALSDKHEQLRPLIAAAREGRFEDPTDEASKELIDQAYQLAQRVVAQKNSFIQKMEQDQFALFSMLSSAQSFRRSTDRQYQQFLDFVNELRSGVYRVALSCADDRISPHFIAFIKAETGERFIFNPSLGILAVPSGLAAERLWLQGTCYGYDSFEFTPVMRITTEDADEVDEGSDDDKALTNTGLVQRGSDS